METITKKRLEKMLKLDALARFSCHSETASGCAVFYAICLPLSKVGYG